MAMIDPYDDDFGAIVIVLFDTQLGAEHICLIL